MSLSKTLYLLLSTGLTQDRKLSHYDRKIGNWDVKHQGKQTNNPEVLWTWFTIACGEKPRANRASRHPQHRGVNSLTILLLTIPFDDVNFFKY